MFTSSQTAREVRIPFFLVGGRKAFWVTDLWRCKRVSVGSTAVLPFKTLLKGSLPCVWTFILLCVPCHEMFPPIHDYSRASLACQPSWNETCAPELQEAHVWPRRMSLCVPAGVTGAVNRTATQLPFKNLPFIIHNFLILEIKTQVHSLHRCIYVSSLSQFSIY